MNFSTKNYEYLNNKNGVSKTLKSVLGKQFKQLIGLLKIKNHETIKHLILDPIYQNDDEKQLFI